MHRTGEFRDIGAVRLEGRCEMADHQLKEVVAQRRRQAFGDLQHLLILFCFPLEL